MNDAVHKLPRTSRFCHSSAPQKLLPVKTTHSCNACKSDQVHQVSKPKVTSPCTIASENYYLDLRGALHDYLCRSTKSFYMRSTTSEH
uniref:Uncharacterized protein n=1 Tax=Physcomitrium patens TaxID=3218 RepID=A0A2K1KU15_PHYPA|nr:hypothetical protein PHYPA_004278 [Physcomitrium patens]